MNLISKAAFLKLSESADHTAARRKDELLTAMVPVSAAVAKELGMELPEKIAALLSKNKPKQSILYQARLSDYLTAIERYGSERLGIKPDEIKESENE